MTARTEETYAALAAAILKLHRPWYLIQDERIPNRGVVCDADVPASHVCQTEGRDKCSEDEHYVDCCNECRWPSEDGDVGYQLWPCDTARLVLPDELAVPGACTCGHARDLHEHYRRGTDCALCSCPRFRRRRWWRR